MKGLPELVLTVNIIKSAGIMAGVKLVFVKKTVQRTKFNAFFGCEYCKISCFKSDISMDNFSQCTHYEEINSTQKLKLIKNEISK